MFKDRFLDTVGRRCAGQRVSITEIAQRRGWSDAERLGLFNPEIRPTDKMIRDLAEELQVDPALLIAALGE